MEHKRTTLDGRVHVRITNDMAIAIEREAARQMVRPQDLVRSILADYIASYAQQPTATSEQSPLVQTQG